MNILIFEWLTSGGMLHEPLETPVNVSSKGSTRSSMQDQGREMLNAISKDFLAAGHQVVLPIDGRLWELMPNQAGLEKRKVLQSSDLKTLLLELAEAADRIMLIAPETGSILGKCLNWLKPQQHKLLNPDLAFTELTSDKNQMFVHLEQNRFAKFPRGTSLEEYIEAVSYFEDWPLPLVLKPSDGAGGEEVQFIFDLEEKEFGITRPSSAYRIESHVSGTPVSVSAICGGGECDLLTPTVQVFDQNHQGVGVHYKEAEYPIDESLSCRAIALAQEVLAALPPAKGYIGIDMVIGEAEEDVWLIEVNPRLTTSYLRLREIYSQNLAALILERACCNSVGLGKADFDPPESLNDQPNPTCCTFLKPCP